MNNPEQELPERIELLPCPFCGSTDLAGDGTKAWRTLAHKEGCWFWCMSSMRLHIFDGEFARRWNTRADLATVVPLHQPAEVVHWMFVLRAAATACGIERDEPSAQSPPTTRLEDYVTCPDCKQVIVGYKFGRAAASPSAGYREAINAALEAVRSIYMTREPLTSPDRGHYATWQTAVSQELCSVDSGARWQETVV